MNKSILDQKIKLFSFLLRKGLWQCQAYVLLTFIHLINPFEGAHKVLHTFSSFFENNSCSFFFVSSFFKTALEFKN